MRRLRFLVPVFALVAALLPGAAAHASDPVLPIPTPLTGSWTAPAGSYTAAATDTVQCASACTVDLTAATITGAGTGYILKVGDGGRNVTLKAGTVSNMAGLVLGQVGAGNRSTVDIEGGSLANVTSGFLYKNNDGGRVDVTMNNVTGTNMGAGVRTWGSISATGNHLTGGGNPSSGNPEGFHAEDLNTTGTPVPDQTATIIGNTVTGFQTTSFQGDSLVLEETVANAIVRGNTFGNNSDADVDTKAQTTLVEGNTLEANAAGSIRLVGAHYGITYSIDNTYAVQSGGAGIEATAGGGPDPTHNVYPGAISQNDVFTLADSTSLVAKAQVTCTGSIGFTGPRAGFVELDHPTWTPAGGTPWAAINGSCSGTSYSTTVNYRP